MSERVIRPGEAVNVEIKAGILEIGPEQEMLIGIIIKQYEWNHLAHKHSPSRP